MPNRLKKTLWIGGIFLLLLNVYRISNKNWNYADPIDFRGIYVGSKLLISSPNLYNDSLGAEIWSNLKSSESFESLSNFGDKYVSISLYPPIAFTTFYPISLVPWKTARLIWWLECIAGLIVLMFFIYLKTNSWELIIFGLGTSATFFALSLGQPLLIAIAFITLSILFYQKNPLLAGALLGIAMIKFSVVMPFGIWFLAKKQFKVVAACSITTILLFVPVLIINLDFIPQWLNKTSWYYEFIYQPNDQNIYTFSNSELSSFLHYYFPQEIKIWKGLNIIGQLFGYGLMAVMFFKRKLTDNFLMIGLLLVSFVFSYHLSYDPLLFLLPLALEHNSKQSLFVLAFLFLLSLPFNAVAADITLIKFNYPILCFAALILFIFAALKNKLVSNQPINTLN